MRRANKLGLFYNFIITSLDLYSNYLWLTDDNCFTNMSQYSCGFGVTVNLTRFSTQYRGYLASRIRHLGCFQ